MASVVRLELFLRDNAKGDRKSRTGKSVRVFFFFLEEG